MMMMHGLLDRSFPGEIKEGRDRKQFLVLDNIAKFFGYWINSNPFDIGTTTRNALEAATVPNPTWKKI